MCFFFSFSFPIFSAFCSFALAPSRVLYSSLNFVIIFSSLGSVLSYMHTLRTLKHKTHFNCARHLTVSQKVSRRHGDINSCVHTGNLMTENCVASISWPNSVSVTNTGLTATVRATILYTNPQTHYQFLP